MSRWNGGTELNLPSVTPNSRFALRRLTRSQTHASDEPRSLGGSGSRRTGLASIDIPSPTRSLASKSPRLSYLRRSRGASGQNARLSRLSDSSRHRVETLSLSTEEIIKRFKTKQGRGKKPRKKRAQSHAVLSPVDLPTTTPGSSDHGVSASPASGGSPQFLPPLSTSPGDAPVRPRRKRPSDSNAPSAASSSVWESDEKWAGDPTELAEAVAVDLDDLKQRQQQLESYASEYSQWHQAMAKFAKAIYTAKCKDLRVEPLADRAKRFESVILSSCRSGYLSLPENGLGANAVAELCRVLCSPGLSSQLRNPTDKAICTSLNLSGNRIGDRGAEELAGMLTSMYSVSDRCVASHGKVQMRSRPVSTRSEDSNVLTDSLDLQYGAVLRSLNLSTNDLSSAGFTHILGALNARADDVAKLLPAYRKYRSVKLATEQRQQGQSSPTDPTAPSSPVGPGSSPGGEESKSEAHLSRTSLTDEQLSALRAISADFSADNTLSLDDLHDISRTPSRRNSVSEEDGKVGSSTAGSGGGSAGVASTKLHAHRAFLSVTELLDPRDRSVTYLDLSGYSAKGSMTIGHEGAQLFRKLLANPGCALRRVFLSNIGLGIHADLMGHLARGLGDNTSLVHLDLSHNGLLPTHIELLVNGLLGQYSSERKGRSRLQKLVLRHNKFGCLGSAHLSDLVRGHAHLAHLDLTKTDTGMFGFLLLTDALGYTSSLRNLILDGALLSGKRHYYLLGLGGSSLGSDSAEDVKILLQQRLQKYSLVGPSKTRPDCGLCVSPRIARNESLRRLSLASCGLTDLMAEELAPVLSAHPTLTLLNLRNNHIKNDGAKALGRLLAQNHVLKSIDLSLNSIGDEGGVVVANSLARNGDVTDVSIQDNELGAEAGKALLRTLKGNRILQRCSCSGNKIPYGMYKSIMEVTARNKRLFEETVCERQTALIKELQVDERALWQLQHRVEDAEEDLRDEQKRLNVAQQALSAWKAEQEKTTRALDGQYSQLHMQMKEILASVSDTNAGVAQKRGLGEKQYVDMLHSVNEQKTARQAIRTETRRTRKKISEHEKSKFKSYGAIDRLEGEHTHWSRALSDVRGEYQEARKAVIRFLGDLGKKQAELNPRQTPKKSRYSIMQERQQQLPQEEEVYL